MPRTIAVGDVHGCSSALHALIDAVQPRPDDTVICLGDLIDNGLDSRGVLDRILELGRVCKLVVIRGNHEEMMLKARRDRRALELWLNVGGQATLDSYGYDAKIADIPARHWRLIEGSVPYFETGTHFFTHANYLPDLPLADQPNEMIRWRSLLDSIPGPHVSGKRAVVGHTPQPSGKVLNLGHLVCIDTGISTGGWLTALIVESGEVWQADERGRERGPAVSV